MHRLRVLGDGWRALPCLIAVKRRENRETVTVSISRRRPLLACYERPQLAHIIEPFQCVYPPNDLVSPLSAQHWRHQGPRLFVHPLGAQWILPRARRITREVADGVAVSERYLHEPAAPRGGIH